MMSCELYDMACDRRSSLMNFRQVLGSLACDLFRDQIQAEKTSKTSSDGIASPSRSLASSPNQENISRSRITFASFALRPLVPN